MEVQGPSVLKGTYTKVNAEPGKHGIAKLDGENRKVLHDCGFKSTKGFWITKTKKVGVMLVQGHKILALYNIKGRFWEWTQTGLTQKARGFPQALDPHDIAMDDDGGWGMAGVFDPHAPPPLAGPPPPGNHWGNPNNIPQPFQHPPANQHFAPPPPPANHGYNPHAGWGGPNNPGPPPPQQQQNHGGWGGPPPPAQQAPPQPNDGGWGAPPPGAGQQQQDDWGWGDEGDEKKEGIQANQEGVQPGGGVKKVDIHAWLTQDQFVMEYKVTKRTPEYDEVEAIVEQEALRHGGMYLYKGDEVMYRRDKWTIKSVHLAEKTVTLYIPTPYRVLTTRIRPQDITSKCNQDGGTKGTLTASKFAVYNGAWAQRLLKQITKTSYDVLLKLRDGSTIGAHKMILCASVPGLEMVVANLQPGNEDSQDGGALDANLGASGEVLPTIEFPDYHPDAVKAFKTVVYTGECPPSKYLPEAALIANQYVAYEILGKIVSEICKTIKKEEDPEFNAQVRRLARALPTNRPEKKKIVKAQYNVLKSSYQSYLRREGYDLQN